MDDDTVSWVTLELRFIQKSLPISRHGSAAASVLINWFDELIPFARSVHLYTDWLDKNIYMCVDEDVAFSRKKFI